MTKEEPLKRVLVIGLFTNPANAPLTQAVELANLLKAKGYQVLTTSRFRNRLLRLIDIVWTIYTCNNKFDVAILQFYSGRSLIWQHIAALLVKLFNKKLVITIHGGAVPGKMEESPQPYLAFLRKADMITCPSSFMIDKLKKYKLDIQLVENSIDIEDYPFFNKTELNPILLWMRAFSPIYNPLMAVRVVKELKKKYPAVKLYMGGPDMGMLNKAKQLIEDEQLEDNIELVGFMDMDKKTEIAAEADIYISTNKIDNAPVTFIEMWAMGLPVVSTNIGGVSYLVTDGVSALLVNDDDHIAMANKVETLLTDNTSAQQIIHNGKELSRKYDRNVVANKWTGLLNSI